MFRESYVNKYVLLRRLVFPTAFNGTVVSLSRRMVKRGTVLPAAVSLSPGTQKNPKNSKSFQNPDVSPRFLTISSARGTRQEGSHLEKRQFFLC